MDRITEGPRDPLSAVMPGIIGPEDLEAAAQTVRQLYVDEKVKRYIVDLVFATREPDNVQGPLAKKIAGLKPLIRSGASPRATIALNLAARAHAFLNHRAFVIPDDVKAIVVSPSIVGDRYVQLAPAYSGGTVLADNASLGQAWDATAARFKAGTTLRFR